MKKSISLLAVAAAVGLSALTASPANAVSFENCDEANAAGYYNIRVGEPGYSPDLDRDGDGVACEDSSKPIGTVPAPAPEPSPAPEPVEDPAPAPVIVSPENDAFDNCAEAAAAGQFNIPVGAPGYGEHLDSDRDGIACETAGESDSSNTQGQSNTVNQIPLMPVGGADTGVATKESATGTELLALGGLVTAAAAGTVVLRRRQA